MVRIGSIWSGGFMSSNSDGMKDSEPFKVRCKFCYGTGYLGPVCGGRCEDEYGWGSCCCDREVCPECRGKGYREYPTPKATTAE